MGWAGREHGGEKRSAYGVLVEKSEGKKEHLEDFCVQGKMILKHTLKQTRKNRGLRRNLIWAAE